MHEKSKTTFRQVIVDCCSYILHSTYFGTDACYLHEILPWLGIYNGFGNRGLKIKTKHNAHPSV